MSPIEPTRPTAANPNIIHTPLLLPARYVPPDGLPVDTRPSYARPVNGVALVIDGFNPLSTGVDGGGGNVIVAGDNRYGGILPGVGYQPIAIPNVAGQPAVAAQPPAFGPAPLQPPAFGPGPLQPPPSGPAPSQPDGPPPPTGAGALPGAVPAATPTAGGMSAAHHPVAGGGNDDHCAKGGGVGTIGGGGRLIGPRNVGANAARNSNSPLRFTIQEAAFQFPPLARQRDARAPAVSWGNGWTPMRDTNGRAFMQHANGTRAYEGVQPKLSVAQRGKVRQVTTTHGPGKQFPNGTIVGIDRAGKPYRMDTAGQRAEIGFGNHSFGGVEMRLFEARTVRVVTPDGRVARYDSRGNMRIGRPVGAAVLGGGAGAGQLGSTPISGELRTHIEQLASRTRDLMQQLEGQVDPALMQQLRASLDTLPAALGQAVSGAGATPRPVTRPVSARPRPEPGRLPSDGAGVTLATGAPPVAGAQPPRPRPVSGGGGGGGPTAPPRPPMSAPSGASAPIAPGVSGSGPGVVSGGTASHGTHDH